MGKAGSITGLLSVGICALAFGQTRANTPPVSSSAAASSATAGTLNQYCVGCHNERLKTAGLVVDPAQVSHVGVNPEIWEKVVQKLRTRAMPPPGLPKPDDASYDSTARFLETELDRVAAANPRPGRLPLLHRLTRTEYQNAIRDLLAVDALPKEMDYSLMLPPDNSASGFDNIAELLFVSPTTLESYLGAARKISRLAVGDPTIPVMVNVYKMPTEQPQDGRVDELPFGTRGGLAVKSDFPADGDYVVKVDMSGVPKETPQLEISVDGERVQLERIGVRARTQMDPAAGGSRVAAAEDSSEPMEFHVAIKAGPRLIGVTFVQPSEARDENVLRPRTRGRGTEPAIDTVTISGPYKQQGPGDTPSRRRIFLCRPAGAAEELPCATKILSTIERQAFRRPVTAADLQEILPFYTAGRAAADFDRGIEKALERILVSPQFLFRIEHDPEATVRPGSVHPISDLELASRISFFLWSSIPDKELLDLASAGRLQDPHVLEQQVRRMLADARAAAMVTNFAAQWLYLRDIDAKEPDELLFPDFDGNLRSGFARETELFLDSALRGKGSVLELLTANYTFVNDRLAKYYGIPNIEGSNFRRVNFPPGSVRGGLLGQGSILTITSYSTRTSPVVRGKWVLENLLSAPPPPPPPNVPALKTEASESGRSLSMREAMTRHRADPACAGCHARMDPIGFAMENFDAVGRWRDTDNGNRIDVSGIFPDGTKFEGMAGLKKALLVHPEEFVSTVASRLMMYAVGRNLQYYDAPTVRAIVRGAAASNYTFSSLVLGVVKSPAFRMRESQPADTTAQNGR